MKSIECSYNMYTLFDPEEHCKLCSQARSIYYGIYLAVQDCSEWYGSIGMSHMCCAIMWSQCGIEIRGTQVVASRRLTFQSGPEALSARIFMLRAHALQCAEKVGYSTLLQSHTFLTHSIYPPTY